jgi:peroxiredoxin
MTFSLIIRFLKLVIIAILLLHSGINQALAQENSTSSNTIARKIIIKDSTGKLYSELQWMKLTTQYHYKLRLLDSTSETLVYLLIPMNETEKTATLNDLTPEQTHIFKTGKKIKKFKIKDLNGIKFSLDSVKGKITVLYFCLFNSPATKFQVEELNKLYTRYENRNDIAFIAIGREEKDYAEAFVKRTGLKFRVCPDAYNVMAKLGIYSWPTHVVLNREGIVVLHNITYLPEKSSQWMIEKLKTENGN